MRGITKTFPGVTALNRVSLRLRAGEVLALMGENGAGKSTLMKVLGGAYLPDEGAILIDGRAVTLRSVRDARRLGIALIHQELMLAPNLDITANIFLGNEAQHASPARARFARGDLQQRTAALLEAGRPSRAGRHARLDAQHRADADGRDRQGALARRPHHRHGRADVVAHGRRIEHLFEIVRQLRDDGIGIVYISHRMEEVLDAGRSHHRAA